MGVILHQVLESLAVDTGERLRDAQDLEVRFGEETITDLLLLELKRLGRGQVNILQTPKHKEKMTGTDWEWWIGEDRIGWLRFAIQAKKMNPRSSRYDGLNHKVGSILQMDLLENYARANKAVALYCLFNALAPDRPRDPPSSWKCCDHLVAAQLTCTITPLSVARKALTTPGCRNFEWIHAQPKTLPWRCLLKCRRIRQHYARRGYVHKSKDIATDPGPFDEPIRVYDHVPREVEDARSTGVMTQFSPQSYQGDIREYPRRVGVFEFSSEEADRIKADNADG
jgi:uncharacterized protein DUF6615